MEIIIGAVITTIGTILVAVISYNYKVKKAIDDISEIKKHESITKEHENLSKEHAGFSKEHAGLSKEHDNIVQSVEASRELLFSKIDETRQITNSIKEIVNETKIKDDLRYDNLTEKQKLIVDSVKNLDQIIIELKLLQEEKLSLIHENDGLKVKCNKLINENALLKSMVNEKYNCHDMDNEPE